MAKREAGLGDNVLSYGQASQTFGVAFANPLDHGLLLRNGPSIALWPSPTTTNRAQNTGWAQ